MSYDDVFSHVNCKVDGRVPRKHLWLTSEMDAIAPLSGSREGFVTVTGLNVRK